ncbi:ABC transporter substrate-binding protein [Brevibacterium antiquum]|uniref:ABC transporter substrate-binding protein n=1 Tax=Brevibacterium antiquum TaxID=234835 RepID=UPI0018E004BD|nr:ABC transporter substrate-binding protein [Brevibacterium antiquum]
MHIAQRRCSGRYTKISAATLTTLIALTGCAAHDPDQVPQTDETGPVAEVPTMEQNEELHERLPQEVLESGSLIAANSGSFPPYEIIGSDGSHSGASADLLTALGQLWGVEIDHRTVDGLPSILTGISAGRYHMGFGPIGDFKERQTENDFVDFVQEFVVFAVPAGNPKNITDLESTCGTKISVMAGGSAERVIKEQSTTCMDSGNPAVEVMTFKDQPQAILAVQSGRADGFFSSQAPLTYFVEEANGKLELAGTGQANGFDTLYQGAVVEKDSELAPLLRDSLQVLFENGTYEAIMAKWNLKDNMIEAPDMNMAVS